MIFQVLLAMSRATCIGMAALTLVACSEGDLLAPLEGEWRPQCGGLAPTGLRITEKDGKRHFTIIGNQPAAVEHITEDNGTITVIAGRSRATITKISSSLITATYYGSEFTLERCD